MRAGRKTVRLFGVIVVSMVFQMALAHGAAAAMRFASTDQWTNGIDWVESDEAWMSATAALLQGTFKQDVFLACRQQAALQADFERDLWCMAQGIELGGACAGNARLAAKTLVFDGEVAGNLLCAASSIDLAVTSSVGGSARLVAENVMAQGMVEGDLTIYAAGATLGGNIQGNVLLVANDITILPTTLVGGNLEYVRQEELILDPRVKVGGQLIKKDITDLVTPPPPVSWMQRFMEQSYFFLAALFTGMVWIVLFPVVTAQSILMINNSLLKCFLTGLLLLLGLPFLIVVLLVSLLGMPLAVVLLMLYGTLLYVGKILPAYFIGLFLLRRNTAASFTNYFGVLASGLVVLYLLALIPGAGLFIWLISTATGLGAFFLAHLNMRQQARIALNNFIRESAPPPEVPPPENPGETSP